MDISVIIPTYNGEKILQKFFLKAYTLLLSQVINELIVVDNNSTDDTQFFIKQFQGIRYLKLDRNSGFTGAINKASALAKSKYLLLLNNDCELTGSSLKEMYDFLQKNLLKATQPIVYDQAGNIENIGYFVDLKYGKVQVVTDKDSLIDNRFANHRYLYGLSGTCLLIEKVIFTNLGGLNQSFHSYLEDVELFFRMNKAQISFSPCVSASCVHAHMSTSKTMGSFKQKRDFLNWLRIIYLHYSLKQIVGYFPTLFVERLRNLNGVLKKL